jgi:peroxiredoxin|tara:strand:- start:2480 stop:2773 length:294 start_codon:yes stop_codon:yes gene_type:complete
LQSAYPQFRDRDVQVVAISMDAVSDARGMAALTGAAFPVLADPGGKTTKEYGVYNLLGDNVAAPSVFIVGSDGRVRWNHIGDNVSDRPTVEQILSAL